MVLQFKSKQNKVYLQGGEVKKIFKSAEAARFEADFLRALANKGVSVPAVIKVEENALFMEFIDGDTLPDFLVKTRDKEKFVTAADALTNWLTGFYTAVDYDVSKEIRGDVNGRNFIICGGKCYGVDFEKHVKGKKERDAGRLLAFCATYSLPDETVRDFFVSELKNELTDRLGLDLTLVLQYFENELDAMNKRRR